MNAHVHPLRFPARFLELYRRSVAALGARELDLDY